MGSDSQPYPAHPTRSLLPLTLLSVPPGAESHHLHKLSVKQIIDTAGTRGPLNSLPSTKPAQVFRCDPELHRARGVGTQQGSQLRPPRPVGTAPQSKGVGAAQSMGGWGHRMSQNTQEQKEALKSGHSGPNAGVEHQEESYQGTWKPESGLLCTCSSHLYSCKFLQLGIVSCTFVCLIHKEDPAHGRFLVSLLIAML